MNEAGEKKDPRRYDDIIDLPHHVSDRHAHMPLIDRAAQFAPFKALTGYEDEVEETARLTDARIEPEEYLSKRLDAQLRVLAAHSGEEPEVTVTFFVPDARKDGGSYETVTGALRRIDAERGLLLLRGGREIPLADVTALGGAFLAARMPYGPTP